jgi:hypothetical protein
VFGIASGSPYHRQPNGKASLIKSTPCRYQIQAFENCPLTEASVENCGSPTLRFGELLDFSRSFCLRDCAAWPAAFQITIKNNTEFSLFELLRDASSKRFQAALCAT